jgi:glycosyltransferase involved in cell wall biosynthesis
LEIILINDGSTDNCGAICDLYAETDSRIRVIHKMNGGLSSARNIGLDKMTGYYCAFVDSDDWIDTEMYATLIEVLESYNADISSCSHKEVYPDFIDTPDFNNCVLVLKKEEAINSLLATNGIRFEVWNKVFKSSIISNIRFKEKQVYEDIYFDRNIFLKQITIVHQDTPYYNYLKVRSGNTNSVFNENRLVIFSELEEFIKVLKDEKLYDSCKKFEKFLLETIISIFWDANRLGSSKLIKESILKFSRNYKIQYNKNSYSVKYKLRFLQLSPSFFMFCMKLKMLLQRLQPNHNI